MTVFGIRVHFVVFLFSKRNKLLLGWDLCSLNVSHDIESCSYK